MTDIDPRFIDRVQAANVAIGEHARQINIISGHEIELPSRAELRKYLRVVQEEYARWAEGRQNGQTPIFDEPLDAMGGPDTYIETRALPMRVVTFRAQPSAQEAQAHDLVDALGDAERTIILGEPGSGKTTALERLAWVKATDALSTASNGTLTLPIPARLGDYRGDRDLVPLLRHSLNNRLQECGAQPVGDLSVRVLLWNKTLRFVLLLDGLNEIERAHRANGVKSIRIHLQDYGNHSLHLTCRTADFDVTREGDRTTQTLPGASLWQVQELVDKIRFWGDEEGESDVRDYLRRHLGDTGGKRLWDRLHADDRLSTLARLPLFLWMFKETAGDGGGELPADRGNLLRRFVNAPRLLGRPNWPDSEMRDCAERSLEGLGWRMQINGVLDVDRDRLYAELEAARGPESYEVAAMRAALQETGLLVGRRDGRYEFIHQLIQEYGAASHLARQSDCGERLREMARNEDHRECCILTLWLRDELRSPDYLLGVMGDATVDLRVRVAAAEVLAEIGDPRFEARTTPAGVRVIEPDMVPIPAGEAILGGDDPEAYDSELPECKVQVAAFEIARYPVTNAEFRCFVEAGGYDDETLWTEAGRAWLRGEAKLDPDTDQELRSDYRSFSQDVEAYIAEQKLTRALDDEAANAYRVIAANFTEDQYVNAYAQQVLSEVRREPYYWHDSRYNGDNQPVVGINWFEAMAYAEWLAKATDRGYRLLTEAEWEWAARRNERRYPWGEDWEPDRCNWSGSRLSRGSPVGVYPHGTTPHDSIHDLGGNVYEWTISLYRSYPYVPDDDREDPEAEGLRVLRGGSWYGESRWVRCAYRGRNIAASNGGDFSGMRLARTLSQ